MSLRSVLAFERLEPRELLAGNVVISEFVASNSSTLLDDNGNDSDWIELHNPSELSVNLAGYTLTDDASNPDKWMFPSVSIEARGFLIVFAGEDANPNGGSDLYTGFGLSAAGEYVGLFDPSGATVSEHIDAATEYPNQETDVSYGFAFQNSALMQPLQRGYFQTPTPGQSNAQQYQGIVEDVSVSADAGFYDAPIAFSLSTSTPGAIIRFTVDGSVPTASNGFTYSTPVTVSSTVNLRTAAFKTNYISSPIETRTYLYLSDILNQSSNGSAPAGWPSSWGDNVVDYGMDPQVIAAEGTQAVEDALKAIPSWSITTDLDNLFHPNTGIYANASQDGRDWERPASVELIQPDGSDGFQIEAGIRIRGGFSRGDFNPKHSFRLFFRSEYGQSTLNYPIHGNEGVDEFRKIDLRTAQNYSWSGEGSSQNNFVQDVLARYSQRDLGQPYTRSSWLHLYLNGQYWGLYQTQERAEANFAASYFGGDPDDYDVIKAEWISNGATDGNLQAYHRLSEQAHARAPDGRTPAFVDDAAYYKAQGLNPDGTANPSFETLLDVDSLTTYMLIVLAGGNLDAPISNFGSNEHINNYYTIRNRNGNEGFKFFVHDSEHTLLDVNQNRNGPWNHSNFDNGNTYFNPQWLHQQLMANDNYRIAFADKVQAAFFNGGAMSVEAQVARLNAEAALIDSAIIAESARWGDSKRSTPYLRSDWLAAINNIRNNYIPNREAILLEQFRNTVLRLKGNNGNYSITVPAPLFPSLVAPQFRVDGLLQHGGTVTAGGSLRPESIGGDVYYTIDGSDPRMSGGGVNSNATLYDADITETTIVAAGSTWRYHDQGVNLGASWRGPGFNDASWSSGDAELGFGDGDESTTVSFGGNPNQKHPTTYFRKQFTLSAGNYSSARLRIKRDDGIVVYLNGTELIRDNMPTGTISYWTHALTPAFDDGETWLEFEIPPSDLLVGSNTLAVEVHQIGDGQGGPVTSTDLSFDAEVLVYTSNPSSPPVVLNESTTVNARTRASDGSWSPLTVADFLVPSQPASSANLRITELNYNPAGADLEFIELQNISSGASAVTIDLGGLTLTDGPSVPFSFPAISTLGPQQYALIVSDIGAFIQAYPDVNPSLILGEFAGALANGGERIRLTSASGETLLEFTYNDKDPWPIASDGQGSSLMLIDPAATPVDQLSKAYRWRGSTVLGGTPGRNAVEPAGVVINEILAHTDTPQVDSIELFNPTATAINIGGWYLSDSASNLIKYEIPSGMILGSGQYVVFDENDFNPNPMNPGSSDFALSGSSGEKLYLSQIVFGDKLTLNFEDAVEFGASFNGQTLGRSPNGSGRFAPLSSDTLGSSNSASQVGPLLISEVNYHPANPNGSALAIEPTLVDDDLEFIEIHNPTNAAIDLTNWRLRGDVDYDFETNTDLPAGQTLVLVSFDPQLPANANREAAFRAQYAIESNVSLVGGFSGNLSNGSARVVLEQPDEAPVGSPTLIPHVVADEVVYDDQPPWANVDGSGLSLNRRSLSSYGNSATSWPGALPSPGAVDFSAVMPTIGTVTRDEGGVLARPDLWSSLEIEFSAGASVSASDLALFNDTTGGSSVDLAGIQFEYNATTLTATWAFDSLPPLAAGYYSIHVVGEFVDQQYVALPGDANLDGDVDISDFNTMTLTNDGDASILLANLGTSSGAVWADGDFNGDGDVDISQFDSALLKNVGDASILLSKLGRNVLPPASAQSLPSIAATEVEVVSATLEQQPSSAFVGIAEQPEHDFVRHVSALRYRMIVKSLPAELKLAADQILPYQVVDETFAGDSPLGEVELELNAELLDDLLTRTEMQW